MCGCSGMQRGSFCCELPTPPQLANACYYVLDTKSNAPDVNLLAANAYKREKLQRKLSALKNYGKPHGKELLLKRQSVGRDLSKSVASEDVVCVIFILYPFHYIPTVFLYICLYCSLCCLIR